MSTAGFSNDTMSITTNGMFGIEVERGLGRPFRAFFIESIFTQGVALGSGWVAPLGLEALQADRLFVRTAFSARIRLELMPRRNESHAHH